MKRFLAIGFLIILVLSFTSCGQNKDDTARSNEALVNSDNGETSLHSPYDSSECMGLNIAQVESLFKGAGFEQIVSTPVDDINSNSEIADGTVISVVINGLNEYTKNNEFSKDAEVMITYHNIPKILVPVSPSDAISMHYMDVGRLFFEAGFASIETDEAYDLSAGARSKTIICANGKEIGNETELPFDSSISIIEHYPISEYSTTINIEFESNLIFSKYNVVVTLAGNTLGTLPHGEDGTYKGMLPPGKYDLVFSNEKDSAVNGSVTLTVDSDTNVTYHISCNRKAVEIETKDYVCAVTDKTLLMPFSSWHFLRKDYQEVVDELKAIGFSNVTAKSTTDNLWTPDLVNTVVGVDVGGKSEFHHDELFDKSASVTVYYHVADFAFEQNTINVTEKDSFTLAYTLTSGDSIDSISFEIDNPDVLQRNEDGSYTALIPGTATITASSGGHVYSECNVEVAEIIVPIDKVVFASSEIDVSVGSTFKLDFTIIPENANYREINAEISNSLLEMEDDFVFYSNEAGDSEILFYQDDRLLGSCVIHASLIEIEELTVTDPAEELFIGDTVDLAFSLVPENATNKGIRVTSSDSSIADVIFDERGASVISIVGKAAGKATVTITTLSGLSYSHDITVKEVEPSEIKLTLSNSAQRIEVGSPITLDVQWQPENTTKKELTWKSSNNKVVKIGKDGSLEAVGLGTATISATHKSGISATITVTVEPTLVTNVEVTTTRDNSRALYVGDKFTITVSVFPENATDKSLSFTSSDESVVKVTNKGVVTAVGVGTADITIVSSNGPSTTVPVTVSPSPQKFRITWSASLASNDHVGYNWSTAFAVNGEPFRSGSTIVLDPDSSFTVYFYVEENDAYPDTGVYSEEIKYSNDLCKKGYTISTTVSVRENGGRYSGHYATWNLKITITPIK